MEKRQRINNLLGKLNDDDRSTLSCLLIKAGYAVKIGKEKVGSKGKIAYYVEYWEETEE
ncbi:MAG: resolvase [Clostridia bacterium]|nr:resolvase [Clostridia bacterium]